MQENDQTERSDEAKLVFQVNHPLFDWHWGIPVIGLFVVMVFIGLFKGIFPLVMVGLVLGCMAGIFTKFSYDLRDDKSLFYTDRFENWKKLKLDQKLAYKDVVSVAYGTNGQGGHFLEFSETEENQVRVEVTNKRQSGPMPVTAAKLISLRDFLYRIVVNHMYMTAAETSGVLWFDNLRIKREGLIVGTELVRWSDVNIRADDSTGRVKVTSGGRLIGKSSMIENNVTAGLIVIRELQAVPA